LRTSWLMVGIRIPVEVLRLEVADRGV